MSSKSKSANNNDYYYDYYDYNKTYKNNKRKNSYQKSHYSRHYAHFQPSPRFCTYRNISQKNSHRNLSYRRRGGGGGGVYKFYQNDVIANNNSRSSFLGVEEHTQQKIPQADDMIKERRGGGYKFHQNDIIANNSSASPFLGTEEHTQQKIQQASDMIKQQLLQMNSSTETNIDNNDDKKNNHKNTNDLISNSNKNEKVLMDCEKNVEKPATISYNVKEIHNKIIEHLCKLNHKKKINFISSTSSSYDTAVQQIQKRKRLELSKNLRELCSQQILESNDDDIDSIIIPDIGIKIEDLPKEVIEEITNTLDFDKLLTENGIKTEDVTDLFPFHFNKTNPKQNVEENNIDLIKIKEEVIDVEKSEEENGLEIITTTATTTTSTTSITSSSSGNGNDNLNCSSELDASCNVQEFDEKPSTWLNEPNRILCKNCNQNYDFMKTSNLKKSTDLIAKSSNEAVTAMMKIDEEIVRLSKIKQTIFFNLYQKEFGEKLPFNTTNDDFRNEITKNYCNKTDNSETKNEIDLSSINEKILVIKILNNTLLATSDSGKLFFKDLINGNLFILYVTNCPITSLSFWKTSNGSYHLFLGSFDTKLRLYNNETRTLIETIEIYNNLVQCMEVSWDYVFIGCTNGNLLRYSIKKNKIEFEEQISNDSLLVLKATQEGARKILLVASRNSPVCIRDAMSGLHMRTMDDLISPTVYSLLLENNLVYCGTTSHDILIFTFHDGSLLQSYKATNSKGIGCMKIVNNLLFASCYNGNIYVYNTKNHKYIGFLKGPGGVIISMEIVGNLIIVGTLSFQLKSILIPDYFLKYDSL